MRKLFRSLHVELWAGLVLLKNPAAAGPPKGWTPVQPLHAEFKFVLPTKAGDDTSFKVYLLDPAGSKIYRLECHDGSYDDKSLLTWSGTYQCALFPYRGDTLTPVNLLATDTRDEQSTDWWNRARLMPYQLQDKCLDYPEYSTLRHFKLRGMDLTLSFTDVVWSAAKQPAVQKFTLTLDAVPDADAKSPMAEKAEGPSPPKGCYP